MNTLDTNCRQGTRPTRTGGDFCCAKVPSQPPLLSESCRISQAASGPDGAIAPSNRHLRGLLLDCLERAVVLGFYGWLTMRVLFAFASKGLLADLLILASEGLVVLLIIIRRPTEQVSHRPADWLLALCATMMPCLIQPGAGKALLPPVLGSLLMIGGIVVQVHAKLVLASSFGCVSANRGLKFSGPYRFVRHPMYAGYLVTHCAFLLMNPALWNLAVYAMCYSLQIPRLLAEERYLRDDSRYAQYADRVQWRLIPGVF